MPWLDLENCAMCKPLMAEEGLMQNMSFAQYNISDGFVAVTNVEADYLEAYRKAHEGMNATVAKLQSGEMLELCGSCMALGACMMKGAKQDYVETPTGDLWVVTATDPELVTELHNWVKRNKEEMEKMKASKG
jgi:TusA-related sulfurtransferase